MNSLNGKAFAACALCLLLLSGCEKETVQYNGKTYSTAALSAGTTDWLMWYNTLSDEDKLKINYIPAELLPIDGAATVETAP